MPAEVMKHYPLILSVAILVSSCREPFSVERFIPAPGPYEFAVDMSDSSAVYDFSFYTRLDGYSAALQEARELPLRVTWTSPSDSVFTENVYLPLEGRSSLFSRQVLQPYRRGVRPYQHGVWTLTVAIPYSDSREWLRGLGLVVAQSFD